MTQDAEIQVLTKFAQYPRRVQEAVINFWDLDAAAQARIKEWAANRMKDPKAPTKTTKTKVEVHFPIVAEDRDKVLAMISILTPEKEGGWVARQRMQGFLKARGMMQLSTDLKYYLEDLRNSGKLISELHQNKLVEGVEIPSVNFPPEILKSPVVKKVAAPAEAAPAEAAPAEAAPAEEDKGNAILTQKARDLLLNTPAATPAPSAPVDPATLTSVDPV